MIGPPVEEDVSELEGVSVDLEQPVGEQITREGEELIGGGYEVEMAKEAQAERAEKFLDPEYTTEEALGIKTPEVDPRT